MLIEYTFIFYSFSILASLASKALRYFENQHGKLTAMTFLEEVK